MSQPTVVEDEVINREKLPEATLDPLDGDTLRIQLERIAGDVLWDQGVATASGQGCIASPGGPNC